MFFVWRSNLLGSSGKGQEYFLRHLLGATHDGPLADPLPDGERPADVRWRDEIPRGKLDLLVDVDFRMTTTGLYSDVVLPAATWYEKHDLSMTDMHPFVHSFNQAIPPPWEARTDWDAFGTIARAFARARRPSTWACAATSSRRRSCTTRRARSPSRAARCATGGRASASRCRAARCRR